MLKIKYEEHHNVKYTDVALDLCVKLAGRFITERAFPDKAIDILDEAGSRTQIRKIYPDNIQDLNTKIKDIKILKQEVIDRQEFELAGKYRDQERELKTNLEVLKEEWKKAESQTPKQIGEDEIRKVVAMITKIPVEKVSTNDAKKFLNLEKTLQEKIIGQNHVLSMISKTLRRNKTGISNPNKPIGTFMF